MKVKMASNSRLRAGVLFLELCESASGERHEKHPLQDPRLDPSPHFIVFLQSEWSRARQAMWTSPFISRSQISASPVLVLHIEKTAGAASCLTAEAHIGQRKAGSCKITPGLIYLLPLGTTALLCAGNILHRKSTRRATRHMTRITNNGPHMKV